MGWTGGSDIRKWGSDVRFGYKMERPLCCIAFWYHKKYTSNRVPLFCRDFCYIKSTGHRLPYCYFNYGLGLKIEDWRLKNEDWRLLENFPDNLQYLIFEPGSFFFISGWLLEDWTILAGRMVYVYVHMHVHIYNFMYMCMNIHTSMYMYTHAYVYVFVYVHARKCLYMLLLWLCIYMYVYVCMCVHV